MDWHCSPKCLFLLLMTVYAAGFLYVTLGLRVKGIFQKNIHEKDDALCAEGKDVNSIVDIDSLKKSLQINSHEMICFRKTSWQRSLIRKPFPTVVNMVPFLQKYDFTQLNDGNENFTIILNTWQRNECLHQLLQHYLHCRKNVDSIAQIRVIWSDPVNEVPSYLQSFQEKNPGVVVFDAYRKDKLTDRFAYHSQLATNALFTTDDDFMVSCHVLSNMFKLWRLLPDYMIGFGSRRPFDAYKTKGKQERGSSFYRKHNSYIETRFWDDAHGSYNILFPTLGSFMHKKYYQTYDNDSSLNGSWANVKHDVNEHVTGEDFTMFLLYTYHTGLPPIAIFEDDLAKELLPCNEQRSVKMHANDKGGRTEVFLDTLTRMGYYTEKSCFRLPSSQLYIDLTSPNETNRYAEERCLV